MFRRELLENFDDKRTYWINTLSFSSNNSYWEWNSSSIEEVGRMIPVIGTSPVSS